MRLLEGRGERDAALNLAREEHAVRHLDPGERGLLLLYVDDPCVVVGRNQCAAREVDLAAASARGVPVLRRISGGGAVYHDAGNLNFGFVRRHRPGAVTRFAGLHEPVVAVLRDLGADVSLNERNDIVAGTPRSGAPKLSGSAQFFAARSMFSHGTLLVNADLGALERLLTPDAGGYETRASPSRRSAVVNLVDLLPRRLEVGEVAEHLARALCGATGVERPQLLAPEDWRAIARLADERYRSWAWNVGESPAFVVERRLDAGAGGAILRMAVEAGTIASVEVRGGAAALEGRVARLLPGARFDADECAERLAREECLDAGVRAAERTLLSELFGPRHRGADEAGPAPDEPGS